MLQITLYPVENMVVSASVYFSSRITLDYPAYYPLYTTEKRSNLPKFLLKYAMLEKIHLNIMDQKY